MTALAQYHAARTALAEATRIDEVLPVLAEIEHVKLYAKQIEDRALLADASVFQLRAERRVGEIIAAAKEIGHFKQGRRKDEKNSDPEFSQRAALAEAGLKPKLSARAQRSAAVPDHEWEQIEQSTRDRIASANAVIADPVAVARKEAERAERREAHRRRTLRGGTVLDLHALAASGFRARTILADPPWRFLTRSEAGEGRSASQYYRTEVLDTIKALPVADLAAPDSVLLMWVVDWAPEWALEVIQEWGFARKTKAFTWVKTNPSGEGWHMGQGYWTRANPEDCWLATRGEPKRMAEDVRQLVIAPLGEHSEKPAEVHDRIERLLEGPYLELFARKERDGWVAWGDELAFASPPLSSLVSQ